MFFFSDVLLRCMYGRFFRGFTFSDFVYGDRGFSKCHFSNLGPALVLILIIVLLL